MIRFFIFLLIFLFNLHIAFGQLPAAKQTDFLFDFEPTEYFLNILGNPSATKKFNVSLNSLSGGGYITPKQREEVIKWYKDELLKNPRLVIEDISKQNPEDLFRYFSEAKEGKGYKQPFVTAIKSLGNLRIVMIINATTGEVVLDDVTVLTVSEQKYDPYLDKSRALIIIKELEPFFTTEQVKLIKARYFTEGEPISWKLVRAREDMRVKAVNETKAQLNEYIETIKKGLEFQGVKESDSNYMDRFEAAAKNLASQLQNPVELIKFPETSEGKEALINFKDATFSGQ